MLLLKCKKIYIIFIFTFLFFNIKNCFFAATYGSDSAVSIENPQGISGLDNIIKTFAFCNNGFSYEDGSATCSWESIFPVKGDIDLSGGKLYLLNDLKLNNVSNLIDIGTIIGRNHVLNLSENTQSFGVVTESGQRKVLSLISRATSPQTINSIDWSYDGNYVLIGINNNSGSELRIYSFDGSALAPVVSLSANNDIYSVRWHPDSYYFATATALASYKIVLLQFTPPNTITVKDNLAPAGTYYSVAWNGSGSRLAAGGTTLTTYNFNQGSEILDDQITPTNTAALNGTILDQGMKWAPQGNKNDLIVVTNNAGTAGSMHLYNFTGSALNHLKNYDLGIAANTLDWAQTSTYVAVGFENSTLKTYQHDASLNTITYKNNFTADASVNSVSFTEDATELGAGCGFSSGNEFYYFDFEPSDYSLTSKYAIDFASGINNIQWKTIGSNLYLLSSDDVNNYLSVYKSVFSAFKLVDVMLFLNNDLVLTSPITFTGNCSIYGNNHSITCTHNGAINLDQNSTLSIKLTKLNFQDIFSFSLQGFDSKIEFVDSIIELNHDLSWGDGSFAAYGDLTITGPYSFHYDTSYTSTIMENANLSIEDGCSFNLGKSTKTQPYEPLEFYDSSSVMNFNDSTLNISDWGWKVKKGVINIYGNSTFDIDYTDTSLSSTTQALVFGDGVNAENDPYIKLRNSSYLSVLNGSVVFDTAVTTSCIQFFGQPIVDIQSTDTIYFKRPINLVNGELITTTNLLFYIDPSSYLTSNQTRYVSDDYILDYHLTGTIASSNLFILDEDDTLHLNAGNYTFTLTINRGNNTIRGVGEFSGLLLFTDYNSTLSWEVIEKINSLANIDLNGGRIIFTKNSGLAPGLSFVNTGTIDLQSTTFELGAEHLEWSGDHYWVGDGATIKFNNDVELDGIWTFSGDVILDGGEQTLILEDDGKIILERGANLTIRNILICNLSDDNPIICSDDNCTITFDYTDIALSGDYLFNKGSLFIYNDTILDAMGGLDERFTFTYASTKTSTIDEMCKLQVNNLVKFSIGRQDSSITNPARQPLVFAGESAPLLLNGGTLHITSSGMILAKGKIEVDRSSNIEVESNQYDYGLVLGDGTAENDFETYISSGCELNIRSGRVFYNNYNEERIVFGGKESAIKIEGSEGLTAYRNMTLKDGSLILSADDNLATQNDSQLIQDFISRYNLSPYSVIKLKVHEMNPYRLLEDDFFYVLEGFVTADVIADSGSSSFGGVAGYSGNLSLKNHTVSLRVTLETPFFSDVTLNGGTISFYNDSEFTADKVITGSGVVQFVGTKLNFGPKDTNMTSTIYWQGLTSGGIDLHSKTSLSGTWTFGGAIQINGNGNILDLSNGGILNIRPSSTLVLDNVSVKGLGNGFGSINFMDDTSTLRLSNAYIELENNFTTTIGGIYLDGPTTLGVKNYNWTIDQNASMTIDGVTLWQDPLDNINYGSVQFGSGSVDNYLTLLSSGTIKTESNLDVLNTDTTFLQDQIRCNSNAIVDYGNHFISLNDGKIYAVGSIVEDAMLTDRGVLSGDINLNGATLSIRNDLQLSSQTQILTSGNLDLYGNALLLEGDITLPENVDLKLTTSGIIDGCGNSLTFGQNSKIRFDEFTTLTLRNIKLKDLKNHPNGNASITILNSWRSQLCLENSEIHLSDNFSLTSGELFLHGDVKICGTSQLNYTSTHAARIASGSSLYFDANTTFSYGPSTTENRDLIIMEDVTSILYFNGATLKSTTTGLNLTSGTLIFDGKNYIYNEDDKNGAAISASQAIRFDNNLNVKIMPAANIEVMSGRLIV